MSEVCNTLTMDKDSGFTLVELLITIIVATILLAVGVPAFQSFVKNNRLTAQANDLISSLQLARSESLKRGIVTAVCASKDQINCTGKGDWADGWIVFSDLNRDGAPNKEDGSTPITGTCLSTEDCIMKISKGLSEGSTLTTDADYVCFLPTGLSGTNTSSTPTSCTAESSKISSFEFILKARNCKLDQARKVTVTKQGHTMVSTCDSCACS